jgi:hypothetical protein
MADVTLTTLPEVLPLEPNAVGFDEITGFTVLRESNARTVLRAFTRDSEAVPIRPNMDVLGLGKCFEIALNAPAAHIVTYYRVVGEPVRFIFESRTPFPNPPQPWPNSVPTGANWPVTWYLFRILLDRIDLQVAGANFIFGTDRSDYSFPELSQIMTALSPRSPYQIVVDGDPTNGKPILRISRLIR